MPTDLMEQYLKANQHRNLAFVDRPYIGTPGAPAQDETNVSRIWAHLNGGFLMGYEYTRWWKESKALRTTAIVGDWSWLNKVRVRGRNATSFLSKVSVRGMEAVPIGAAIFTPMLSSSGNVAEDGVTLKLDENDYLFTQSGAQFWLPRQAEALGIDVSLQDETPLWTCFAVQGPQSRQIVEEVVNADFSDLKSRQWRWARFLDSDVIVSRQGVTGELGFEFFMRTDQGEAHELWRKVRAVGNAYGLRELGFKAQMIGHTESNFPTVIRDFMPDRFDSKKAAKFARLWVDEEEFEALDYQVSEHFVTPASVGWEHVVEWDHEFVGRDALVAERDRGGPTRKWRSLVWNSKDMGQLFADQFLDGDCAPPPDLPWGQFRMHFLRIEHGGQRVGWASGMTYSPSMRRMISNCRIDRTVEDGAEVTVEWAYPGSAVRKIRAVVKVPPLLKR